MNDQVDLKIFHYHFLTGGVSTVVRQAVEAFHAHLPGIRSVELVAGAIPGDFRSSLEGYAGKCTEMPQIGYRQQADERQDQDKKSVAREAAELAETLLRSFGSDDSVWWVHNYHLGKNVVFTQALLDILHSDRPQRIILQIHDFPECGRFANLGMLKAALSLDPYPVSPWVRYAVLNRRDRDILTGAGVPVQDVFLLENPVLRGSDPGSVKTIRPVLKKIYGSFFPRFDPKAPLLLYPVRTIRRKNVLEALLLCLLLDRGANLVITLPGVSASERRYSDLVEGLFADQLCPGLWGIGTQLQRQGLRFDDLVAASDMVISTSVQEGFGYLFINSLLWSLPVVARDLNTLAGLRGLFQEYSAYFYDTIRVQVQDSNDLTEAYRSKIKALSPLIGRAEQERLSAGVEALVRDDLVDFSFLPVEAQEKLLRKIAAGEGAELRMCRRENRITLTRIEELLATRKQEATDAGSSTSAQVDRRFGAMAYAAGFRRILDSFRSDSPRSTQIAGEGIAAAVQKAFLQPEQLRLLYDY